MHLPRHTLSSQIVAPALVSATFNSSYEGPRRPDQKSQTGKHLFTCATRSGFIVAQTWPLKIVARKDYLPDQGGLSAAYAIGDTSLLLLVGGGRVPRYAPNKVVIWDESASFDGEPSLPQRNEPRSDPDSRTASTVFDAGSTFGSGSHFAEDLEASSSSAGSVLDDDVASESPVHGPQSRKTGSSASDGNPTEEYKQSRPSPKHQQTPPPSPRHGKSQRTGREVMELEFDEAVRTVCVRSFALPPPRDSAATSAGSSMALIVVVLKTKAVIFELGSHLATSQQGISDHSGWGIIHRTTIAVLDDGRGLVDMARVPGARSVLIALSGRQKGHAQIVLLSMTSPKRSSSSSTSSGVLASSIIAAHTASLVSLCLSADASLLVTASSRGTLIRLWSTLGSTSSTSAAGSRQQRPTVKTVLQQELRRGTEQAAILSMALTPDRSILAAASDKGTIHFFNFAKGSSPPSEGSESSTPQVGSLVGNKASTVTLSTAAARYLPSAVNQLASQIPSNMIPQYLKSHWSTAQFRIKLRSFASHNSEERAKKTSEGRRGPSDSSRQGSAAASTTAALSSPPLQLNDAPRGNAGVAKSTEGAWATLKGRVEDIMRWEPALDERIFLTWVSAPTEISDEVASSSNVPPASPYHLVALTSSGSWYRVSLTGKDANSGDDAGDETVVDMYKGSQSNDTKRSAVDKKPNRDGTNLEEFQTLRLRDEWDG